MLLFFPFFLFAQNFDPDKYETTQKITQSENCEVYQCLFININGQKQMGGGLQIDGADNFDVSIYETTFMDINVQDGAGFCFKQNVGVTLNFVCFADCTVTNLGSAFYYQNMRGDRTISTLNFLSISNCQSGQRSIYLEGHIEKRYDLSCIHSNFSTSKFTADNDKDNFGLYLFCDYCAVLEYCTFEKKYNAYLSCIF